MSDVFARLLSAYEKSTKVRRYLIAADEATSLRAGTTEKSPLTQDAIDVADYLRGSLDLIQSSSRYDEIGQTKEGCGCTDCSLDK